MCSNSKHPYTCRLDAKEFTPSRSQRQLINRSVVSQHRDPLFSNFSAIAVGTVLLSMGIRMMSVMRWILALQSMFPDYPRSLSFSLDIYSRKPAKPAKAKKLAPFTTLAAALHESELSFMPTNAEPAHTFSVSSLAKDLHCYDRHKLTKGNGY